MHICFTSARRVRPFRRLSAALLVLAFTASCSSTQPAYLFRPAAPSLTTPPAKAEAEEVAVVEPEAATVPPKAMVSQRRQRIKPRQLRQALRLAVAQSLVRVQTGAKLNRPATQAVQHKAEVSRKPTEVGLGTTVFGILGFLAVPIGLIGLALGGGLVWGIIAAAGALAILIAWIDPFA
ncbi:hypothetical protein [Hymenobacter volaticus]|uniref:Uncharacterized protein n=1 Tax=Hymenobacter volaticus TaxID=2932254 RepID=A0ABY4G682_9BACT|nr:hypothetical protein [Hymenobacter volaticus]UOQ66275.1 hypothetical protein MUN86_22750 [Hymenobacter volaticus]